MGCGAGAECEEGLVDVRTCPNCGRQNADDQDFCVCGEYLRWEPTGLHASAPAPSAPAPSPPGPAGTEPPPPRAPDPHRQPADVADGSPATPAAPDPVSLTLRLPGDQFADTLDTVRVSVDPGGRAVLLALVRNQDAIVDNYDISVVGLPPGWTTIAPPTVYLVPFGAGGTYEQEVEIHVHPPRAAQAEARTWSFDVCVWSRAHQIQASAAPASVDIAPYEELRAEVTPDRQKGRRQAQFVFGAENRANAPTHLELAGADADGECTFHFAESNVVVGPGERVEVPFVVRPPRQIWLGRARDRQFEATARPLGGDLPAPPQPAVFRQRSWLPPWLVVVVPILAAAVAAALLLIPKKVTVPNFKGAPSPFAVQQKLAKARLNPVPNVTKVTSGGPLGTVVAQTPAPGSKVRVGTAVTIAIAVGSSQVTVPSVMGKNVEEALTTLDAAGLKLGQMLPPPSDPAATIQKQIPPPGAKANRGDAVMLIVVHPAQGSGGGTTSGSATTPGTGGAGPPVAVPKIAPGQSVQAAAASLAQAGLLPTTVQRIGAVPAGALVGSIPAAGANIPRGGTVQLVVSAGFPTLLFDTADSLMEINAAGAPAAPLPGTNRGDDEATWSADGTHIAYRSGSAILLAPPGQPGTPAVQPAAGQAFHDPAFAPQGHVLAVVRAKGSGRSLCFVDVGAGGQPDCVNDPAVVLGRSITWSHDGKDILAAGHARGRPTSFGLFHYHSDKPLSATAADWGKSQPVSDMSQPNKGALAAAFSPDGTWLAATANTGGSFQLYLTTADDLTLRRAKLVPVPSCQVTWQPDSAALVVTQNTNCTTDAHGALYRVDPSHPDKPVQLATIGANPAWQPLPPAE